MVTSNSSVLRQPVTRLFWCYLALAAPAVGFAESPRGDFDQLELSIETAVKAAPQATRSLSRYVIDDAASVKIADLRLEDDKPVLRIGDRRSITLPLRMNTAVSRDGQTIVQHGDALMRMHPVRTDLYWINSDGEISNSVRNAYDGNALIDMSGDGFTAVAGQEFFKESDYEEQRKQITHIDLYGPDGQKLDIAGTTSLRVMAVRALPSGQGVLVNTSSATDPLRDHQLFLYREGRQPQTIDHEFGIVQKIVTLRSNAAFVQGTAAYGMINTVDAVVIWRAPDRVRLISPQAAALDLSQNRLFLMTGTRVDQDTLSYEWTLSILAADTGKTLGQIRIPGLIPSTPDPVFTNIRVDQVTVLAGERQLTVRLAPLP